MEKRVRERKNIEVREKKIRNKKIDTLNYYYTSMELSLT